MILFFFLMQLKHLIVDFFLQTPYQYRNKGDYGHFGGILHSFLHVLATAAILIGFQFSAFQIWMVVLFEFLIHYHIDWAKMNWFSRDIKTKEFWAALGFDQLLHQLTYIFLIFFFVS